MAARRAARGSWVTMMIVLPNSRLKPLHEHEHIFGRDAVQVAGRLVGHHDGRVGHQARAMATRCCWPPESCRG